MNPAESVPGTQPAPIHAHGPLPTGRVLSKDGTLIAYDRTGSGPPIIIVEGALCSRTLGPAPKLAPMLAHHFTVYTYDRRGRGDSTDKAPYAVAREVEDLEALLKEAGGPAFVLGHSSGAVLALHAAARGLPITRLALYEAPLIIDRAHPSTEKEWQQIDTLLGTRRRAEAVKVFLRMIGMPAIGVAVMRFLPVWSRELALAQTLAYDGELVRELQRGVALPEALWSSAALPTLVMAGGKSPAWLHTAARAIVNALPHAHYRSLEGQAHDVSARALVSVLSGFFGAPSARAPTVRA